MKYRNLLFDADGTLFDFSRSEKNALSETLRHFQIPPSEEICRTYSEANAEQWALLEKKQVTRAQLKINRFQNLCQRIGVSKNAAEMAEFYEDSLSRQSFLIDGAEDICQALSRVCDLHIVTNGFHRIQTGRFRRSPLLPYFKNVFISEDIGIEKPDARFFEAAVSAIPDFSKETALIIGDSLSSDMQGGINFGIDTCWFNPQRKAPASDMPLTYVIDSLSQLQHIVLRGE